MPMATRPVVMDTAAAGATSSGGTAKYALHVSKKYMTYLDVRDLISSLGLAVGNMA